MNYSEYFPKRAIELSEIPTWGDLPLSSLDYIPILSKSQNYFHAWEVALTEEEYQTLLSSGPKHVFMLHKDYVLVCVEIESESLKKELKIWF